MRETQGAAGLAVAASSTQPVVLSSIHNDGMALEMKIKDILKWKLETFEQKQKIKDEKQMQLEVTCNRLEKQLKDTIAAISDATQQEFHKMQNHILSIQDKSERFEQQIGVIKETLLHQVT
jgi:DNA anti-recombination protein RmuC